MFELFLLDQGTFCGATDYPYFGLRVTLPMDFKARVWNGGSTNKDGLRLIVTILVLSRKL